MPETDIEQSQPHRDAEEAPAFPFEDIGDVADDDSDEFDNVDLPHRGPDN